MVMLKVLFRMETTLWSTGGVLHDASLSTQGPRAVPGKEHISLCNLHLFCRHLSEMGLKWDGAAIVYTRS